MNKEIFPSSMRMLLWVIAIAVISMIALTGYIAVQVEEIDQEVYDLRQQI